MTNRPICASQPTPSAKPLVAGAVRQPGVAEEHGRGVDGEEPARPGQVTAAP